ncbi:MAG: condensation domain-containing protein, partial [Acidobacteriota bacterium]|nr:condensation domain-containing protein [Acidobacteriota bacterium]
MNIGSLSEEQRELLALLLEDEEFQSAATSESKPVLRAHGDAVEAPLSFAQQRLWFLDQMEPGSSAYNIAGACRVKGALDLTAMRRALDEIMTRHQALRATFHSNDGSPVQRFLPAGHCEMPLVDLSHIAPADRLAAAQELCAVKGEESFDLSRGPLFRTYAYRLDEDDHLLLVVMHHIVSDGWSLGLLTGELGQLYQAYATGQPSPLARLPVQYSDYAIWQREWLRGSFLEEQLAFWKKQLAGRLPYLEVPADKPRPAIQTFNGTFEPVVIAQGLPGRLSALAQREGATLFMTLLAAFQTMLWRYTNQDDMLIGTPIAGRNHAETEKLVGLFLNTLVFRTDMSGNPTFRELLRRVKAVALDAYNHQDVPFEKLVEELLQERDLSRSPLFQVMFILQVPNKVMELHDLTMTPASLPLRQTKYELTLFLWEHEDRLEGHIEYNTDLFEEATINRMIGHLKRLLDAVVANPDQPIANLPLLTASERNRLLVEYNLTGAQLPEGERLHDLVSRQAARSPASIAVSFGSRSLTYAELEARGNSLARYLQTLGAGPESLVAVYLERSEQMLIALLGVLKAGAAYVPVDPAYPADRVAFMLEDSKAAVVLTESSLRGSLPQLPLAMVAIDAEWDQIAQHSKSATANSASPESPAYVIYTSGSTGRPKGVVIPHRAAVNFLRSMARQPGMSAGDTILAVTTLSFDIAGLEMFLPLTVGARIEIASREDAMDAGQLNRLLATRNITVMQATPATWRMLLESGWTGNPKLKILCGGEALPRDLANQLTLCAGEVWNMYGPTETTIWSTVELVEAGDGPVLIGRPIDNTQVYICDANLQPAPAGIPG